MLTNVHPPLSAFPLALCTVIVILEIVNFVRPHRGLDYAILVNLIFLVLGISAAFFSGYQAAENASLTFSVPQEVITTHHNFGRLALFCAIPCAALRFIANSAKYSPKLFKVIYFALLIALSWLIIETGRRGGALVFDYGAGVSVKEK